MAPMRNGALAGLRAKRQFSFGRLIGALGLMTILVVVGLYTLKSVAGQLAPALGGYSVTIAAGVNPVTPAGQVAAVAGHYLDEQTPDIAAPELHIPPRVLTEVATLAPDARRFEPAISAAQAAAQPGRIVWIVQVSGDFLNLRDLPWSRQGAPDPSGNIVIDDATGTILGVYPHDPPGT